MAPRMEDVLQQAMECEEKYLSKANFHKSVNRILIMTLMIIVTSLGVLITCNTRITSDLASYASAVKELSSDQDNTRIHSERMNEVIVEQGLILESLKTSTAQMNQQVDRLVTKADRTTHKLDAILVEVRKP